MLWDVHGEVEWVGMTVPKKEWYLDLNHHRTEAVLVMRSAADTKGIWVGKQTMSLKPTLHHQMKGEAGMTNYSR